MKALHECRPVHRQAVSGFTLVELLIVLALSSLLSAALYQVFLGNRKNVELLDAYAKVQESGRFGMDYLARDLRMAGYLGCVNSDRAAGKVTNMLDTSDAEYDPQLHAFDATMSAVDNFNPANPAHVSAVPGITPLAGTDVFMSSGAVATDLYVHNAHSSASASLEVQGPMQQMQILQEGMVVMITDCNTAHIFAVSNSNAGSETYVIRHNKNVSEGPDNTSGGLGVNYAAGSQVHVMNTTAYFVAPSQVVPGQNSLYRLSLLDGSVAQELVPYVDNLQMLYGVDTNDDRSPDEYKTASQISADGDNMSRDVYSVHVELLLAAPQDVGSAPVAGFADDGRLRKRYTRIVNIRNAGIASY